MSKHADPTISDAATTKRHDITNFRRRTSGWDGEGEVEWLASEPAILGFRSDLMPRRCRVILDGSTYFLDWPSEDPDLLFCMEGLAVGTRELAVTLLGEDDRQLATGLLTITIRDPQVRPEGASVGEGIRMLAMPAHPTLGELWDQRAVVTVDGPQGSDAELTVTLSDDADSPLAIVSRSIRLPFSEGSWKVLAKSIRDDRRFSGAYDEAESCTINITRAEVGYATLSCDRGFRPLRWRFSRSHDGTVTATLVDRTDSGNTTVDFYDVEKPLMAVRHDTGEPLEVPPRGGLVIARAGDATVASILPTHPNALLKMPRVNPVVRSEERSPSEILRLAGGHRNWIGAELPPDPFAAHERQLVSDAITRAIGAMVGGSHWASLERKLGQVDEAVNYLEDMQTSVGISRKHRALASTIAYSLHQWLTPMSLQLGFNEVITPYLEECGITAKFSTSRFLLLLAGRPGRIAEWDVSEAASLLESVLRSPILYRAARFAVLGTRSLNDAEVAERGF